MRTLLIVSALLLLAAPAPARADATLHGFDHAAHAAGLQKRGKTVECQQCHHLDKNLKLAKFPDKKHRPCSDAGCHSPWPLTPTKQEGETYCLVCHRPEDIKKGKIDSFYPPFDVNPDHVVPFPHAKHAGAPVKLCAGCHQNHGEPAGTAPATGADAHATCGGCHEKGAEPLISNCGGCHKDKATTQLPVPDTTPNPYRTTPRFDHARHAAKVGSDDGKKCATCHESLAKAQGFAIPPRPAMETCGKCHDGQKAAPSGGKLFAITGSCNRCHGLPGGQQPGDPPAIARPEHFSHAQHAGRGVDAQNCATCHSLDQKLMPSAVTSGQSHQPCAGSNCHKDEFSSRAPTICSACHVDFRPYAPARFQPLAPSAQSEFGRDFSHLSHVKNLGEGANGFCVKCHADRFETQPTPQSHGTCAPCHGQDAAPKMNQCGGCHQLGKPSGALAARDPSFVYYVRDKFRHDQHGTDPRSGQPTTCLFCHTQVVQAQRLADIGRPNMKQCDACHDGKSAFKDTGFECYRCHGKKK
jgi:c(7)-type cytochrome triheme protein